MQRTIDFAALLIVIATTTIAQAEERVLFRFDRPDSAKPWQTVNDGVMGGRSIGRFRINEDKKMEFFGTLSLQNNGGFASVRARDAKLVLGKDDVIVARVKGDGRDHSQGVCSVECSSGRSPQHS